MLFSAQSLAAPSTDSPLVATKFYQLELTKPPIIAHKQVIVHPKPLEKSGFDTLLPRLTASNSSLFLYHSQVDPDYELLIEFFAENWGKAHFLAPPKRAQTVPWFAITSARKSRISGWKDANLIYKARATYHS
ncbi:hypothetical protein AT00_06255 [Pseudoalteromonas lipolytica SCSIO 04301]|uniref:Uncharacterized protein n=1 Tax=Pseudoalteromonas lipolytica TaxID=570156 RepID=A0ABY1G9D5_9GAMM|nr:MULTISPECIES: hypothetical protein [Pseudoalteromonas]EWH07285.1 hypothetical protein AT00_06255 [Pseudoalteromonas lipolytica SCSIO 04301]SFT34082.1 hypothetical protein SAMN04487854_101195 [Pseudoalteromonas lipolytica]